MVSTPISSAHVGIVVIGRNEGPRLKACLESVVQYGVPIVYVDSGSSDGSVDLARRMGVEAIELPATQPFTAARARNTGWRHLRRAYPAVELVQFVDGDCILRAGWIEAACAVLKDDPQAAVACGRVRERYPATSIYNRICDLEWKQPVGRIEHCGGNCLIRLSALREAGGYNAEIIAAEDTELCTRLRLQGWTIISVDADMVLHDAAMLYAGQWFRRAMRAGHAISDGAARHGRSPARLFVRAHRRIALYGWVLPMLMLVLAWPTRGASFVLLLAYPLLVIKTYVGRRQSGESAGDAGLYALHCAAAKAPQALGQLVYHFNQLRGRRTLLIEHKQVTIGDAGPQTSGKQL